MKPLLFALPGNERLARSIAEMGSLELGKAEFRSFPDGETYVRLCTEVKRRRCILICTLDRPDRKVMPLYFLAQTITDLGGHSTCLLAPYLAYMRQDRQFKEGEGVTSKYFAELLSRFAGSVITIDPHLHRRTTLGGIYRVPTTILHAAGPVSSWVQRHVEKPVLIGPDQESAQWVSQVADESRTPYMILEKARRGDREVKIRLPDIDHYRDHTPVLLDDIISTGETMLKTVELLEEADMKPPVCIGIHAVFSGSAYQKLMQAYTSRVVTCNTIPHCSNQIKLDRLCLNAVEKQFSQPGDRRPKSGNGD
ncbi:ribose-phosphate diphosphokinase [Fodinibius sediminis]|uniref:ribose-phosphate diphosphokinase n=1 Tax=Fodinibius sediminis TaxID=1214077 RepID=A0A521CM25_9BACT|nr:ribose-phosphate diphosphokinase [Fodinibius sediminis]SMO60486.1 ribose-phosphate pyrophosphokinase [Fodinibius sediminis]